MPTRGGRRWQGAPAREPRVAAEAEAPSDDNSPAQQVGPSHRPAADEHWDRDVHASRDQDYPSDEPIHEVDDGDWTPPALLDAPPPRPGFVQRWIRAMRGSQDDARNFSACRRQGWQPRDPSTVPGGFDAPTAAHGSFGSCIMVEGMVLCEMTVRRAKQRHDHYAQRLGRQTQAVDQQLLKVQQPGHPIDHQAATKVTRGRGPRVQEDDEAA